jgi:hypothetical protein
MDEKLAGWPMLPHDIFSNRKSQFGKILEGLATEDVGIFMAILFILWPLCLFYGHLVHFVVIGYIFSSFGMSH